MMYGKEPKGIIKLLINYEKKLDKRATYFIGLFISFALVWVLVNSIYVRPEFEPTLYTTIAIWTIVFVIKPFRSILCIIAAILNMVWLSSLIHFAPYDIKAGLGTLLPGIEKFSEFALNKLGGNYYLEAVQWISKFILNVKQPDNVLFYNIFIGFLILSMVSIVVYLIEKRVSWRVFLVGGLYYVVAWFLYVEHLQFSFSVYFVGVTMYRQFITYESVVMSAEKDHERTRYYNYTSAMAVGTGIMTAVLFISSILLPLIPIDDINMSIDGVAPKVSILRTEFVPRGSSQTFSFSRTMYSPNGSKLGGPIMERDYSVVMRIRAEEGGLYLRGRSKNLYENSQWKSNFNVYNTNVFVGDLFSSLPKEELSEIQVYPENITTRTLFSPYMYYISNYSRSDVYGNKDRITYVKSGLDTDNQPYTIWYVNKEFIGKYDELETEDRSAYLQVPKNGLEKVDILTEGIIADLTDPHEKMKAIESHLRENYRYSLNTDPADYDVDFVENFLFDERRGYCTYFATSMAIMGRFADVPTRYVEGYISNDFTDADGLYEVTANRAHAWVEAFIEGEGWVRYEPTPAYSPYEEDDESTEEELYELNSDVDIDLEDFVLDANDEEDISVPTVEPEEETNEFPVEKVVTVVIYLILITGMILILYKKRRRLHRDIHDGDLNQKIENRIYYMLSMASLINVKYNQTEVPKSVIIRICKSYLVLEVPTKMSDYIDQSLYSLHDFTEEEYEEINAFFEDYEQAIKKKLNVIGYTINKYILNTLYHSDYYK